MAWFLVGLFVGFLIGVPVGYKLMAYGMELIRQREPETLREWISK